jgi:hypothetical protein
MSKKTILGILSLMGFLAILPAAADETAAKPTALPTVENRMITKLFNPGDKIFSISLGVEDPLFNINPNNEKMIKPKLSLGGSAELEWDFFVLPGFALGGQLGGAFNSTPASRTLFMVPITFKTTYFFASLPWEFPVGLGVGTCIDTVSDSTHVDLFFKPQAGVFYRATPDWSFGMNLSYWIIPQFYSAHPQQSRIANILGVTLSGLYHF